MGTVDEAAEQVRKSLARVRDQVSARRLDSLRQEVSEALAREPAITAAV